MIFQSFKELDMEQILSLFWYCNHKTGFPITENGVFSKITFPGQMHNKCYNCYSSYGVSCPITGLCQLKISLFSNSFATILAYLLEKLQNIHQMMSIHKHLKY